MTARLRKAALVFVLAALIAGVLPASDLPLAPETGAVRLPASLRIIEDAAFEGTALANVELPEGLIQIGDRAFADNPELMTLTVPDSVLFFGQDILEGADRAEVIAALGSPAADWALSAGYRLSPRQLPNGPDRPLRLNARRDGEDPSETPELHSAAWEPPGRRPGELKAEACTGCYAFNVRTRYFP